MRRATPISILTIILTAIPMLSFAQGEAAYSGEEMSGTWNVTIKPTGDNTCDRGTPKIKVRQWLMAVNDNEVEVEVLGNNRYFPALKGTYKDGTMLLTGEGKSLPKGETVKPTIALKLKAESGPTLNGEYYFLGVSTTQTTCVTFYEVEAKKQ